MGKHMLKYLFGVITFSILLFGAEANAEVTFSMNFSTGQAGTFESGSNLTYTATFTPPNGEWVNGDITYTSTISGPETDSNETNSISHTFDTPGMYTVKIIATGTICWGSKESPTCDTFKATATTGVGGVIIFGGAISGSDFIQKWKTGKAPTKSYSATGNQPSGTTYKWSSETTGTGSVKIEGSDSNNTVTISGQTPSTILNDVKIKLKYSLNGKDKEYSHLLTVDRPASLEHGTPLTPTLTPNAFVSRLSCTFLWTLKGNYMSAMDGVNCTEKVSIDFFNSNPKRFIPIPITGSATTNAQGQISDTYGIKVFGTFPQNTDIKATQTITCGGYSGTNSIDVYLTSISTTNPVNLN